MVGGGGATYVHYRKVCIITGDLCQYNIDECKEDPCQNGGICFDEIGSYYCKCPPGYDGKQSVIIFLQMCY
jgi:hypothetical protein